MSLIISAHVANWLVVVVVMGHGNHGIIALRHTKWNGDDAPLFAKLIFYNAIIFSCRLAFRELVALEYDSSLSCVDLRRIDG